mmetsp:Transcript_26678/g.47008  ORF Transcript_26678/g.47008 Transcript_26678/m.47008 type:complete len:104 (+) Transcript_26678:111-422(+)
MCVSANTISQKHNPFDVSLTFGEANEDSLLPFSAFHSPRSLDPARHSACVGEKKWEEVEEGSHRSSRFFGFRYFSMSIDGDRCSQLMPSDMHVKKNTEERPTD